MQPLLLFTNVLSITSYGSSSSFKKYGDRIYLNCGDANKYDLTTCIWELKKTSKNKQINLDIYKNT